MTDERGIFMKFKERLFKKKEKATTVVGKIKEIMNLINLLAYTPGLEFVDDWKKSYRTAFAIFVNSVATFISIYTFLVTFPAKENVALVGFFAFNGMIWGKLLVVMTKHDKFMSVVQYVFKVFNSNTTGPRGHILMGVTKLFNYHLLLNFSSFLAGYAIYSTFPLYDYFFYGRLTLVSPLLVPKIDPENLRGYFITTSFNVFLVSYCLNICLAVSSLFFLLVDTYGGLVSLVEHDLNEFDDMCERKESTGRRDAKMRNTMMELMDIARFSNYLNDLYDVIATVQIVMSAIVMLGSLAAILAINYKNCIGGFLSFYTELLMYCYIGQLLDDTNMRIINVISQAKWYTYELKYQKDIHIALYLAQNMEPIRLAGVIPLNFETGLMITNKIYTAFMFMLELIE
uniref:Odorant receptor n=1 Tax=Bradysia odoriphaga TaxID=1564500 RepID=A0A6B9CFT9_9DIPT|nr:odorant receptor 3 [Bradysia odoriphaga]